MAWPTSDFPSSLDVIVDQQDDVDVVLASDINGAYDCIEKIQAKIGVDSSAVTTSLDYIIRNTIIPSGTKAWFYQNTAPVGWTIDATPSDALLAVKGGATYVTGGTQVGSWTQSSHSHSCAGVDHLHSTASVVLTAAQSGLPSHAHSYLRQFPSGFPNPGIGSEEGRTVQSWDTSSYASANASEGHSHGSSLADRSLAFTSGASATVATWRPLAQVGIIATKNAYQ